MIASSSRMMKPRLSQHIKPFRCSRRGSPRILLSIIPTTEVVVVVVINREDVVATPAEDEGLYSIKLRMEVVTIVQSAKSVAGLATQP